MSSLTLSLEPSSKKIRCHQCSKDAPDRLLVLLSKLSKVEVNDYISDNKNYCQADWMLKYMSDPKRCKSDEICYTMTIKTDSK